jgi:hypothetical protein
MKVPVLEHQSRSRCSSSSSLHASSPAPKIMLRRQPYLRNQVAQRQLERRFMQAKLSVNQPGDKFELEADRIADQVMRMPDLHSEGPPRIQRMCAHCQNELETPGVQRLCPECEEEMHRKAGDGGGRAPEVSSHLESQIASLRGGGQPLLPSTRSFFERRFGRDFGDVRVHTSGSAAETARSLDALAYTAGSDIVFAPGQYSPATSDGNRLLAHELTHVVQQDGVGATIQRSCGSGLPTRPCDRGPRAFVRGLGPFRFVRNCDDFRPGEASAMVSTVRALPAGTTFEVHGFASVDSPALDPFNERLSCARAVATWDLLAAPLPTGAGLGVRIKKVVGHGPTPGPSADRRTVVIVTTTPSLVSPPPPPHPSIAAACLTPPNPDESGSTSNPTTSGQTAVASSHLIDSFTALSCRGDAFDAAGASGLSGPHLGPQDAFRHCFWSCCMAKSLGAAEAEQFGTAHENSNPSSIPFDNQMDLHDNSIGRGLAGPTVDCDAACKAALSVGRLRTIRGPAVTIATGRSSPVTPDCIGASNQAWP